MSIDKNVPPYVAHFDGNQVPSLMGVEGTLGTADAGGTARPLPVGVNPTNGALYVQDLSVAAGTTNVQIVGGTLNAGTVTTTLALNTGTITTIAAGTQNTLGTVGTNVGIGTLTNVGRIGNIGTIESGTITTTLALNTGTITTIAAGTQNTLGTVGTTIGLGTITNLGSVSNVGSVSTLGTIPSFVDANNSTTTTLAANGTYTGTATDVLNYRSITTHTYSDVVGAANGLKHQFSPDGTNWDDSYTWTVDAGTARRFQLPVTARYYRNVYINGAGSQGVFRHQTLLHPTSILTTVHRLGNDVSPDRSAQIVKAALMAQVNGAGDFTPIQSNTAGVLKVGGGVEVNTGTITTIVAGTQNTLGTVGVVNNIVTGTLANSGTTTGVGVVTTVTTVSNLTAGSVRMTVGTLTTGSLTDLTNLYSGSVRMTVGTLTTGTLQNLVTGTINALASGTVTGGTLGNLNYGTIAIDAKPAGSTILTTHTLGTGGGTFFGTILSAVGAGTYIYLTGVSIVARSGGSVDCGIANNVAGTTGAGVVARGFFPTAGGGIRQEFNPALRLGTNGTLAYFLITAGTVDFTVQYWVGP